MGASDYLSDSAIRLLVEYFAAKGLHALKREDRAENWYPDWIDYQGRHGLYAGLLSPARYSSRGHRFDLRRLTRFLETFAYFSPAHGYSLHVSFLGLFPILMSANEPLKREAIAKLEAGGLFAFGVSEKAHGADLFANEFTVTKEAGGRRADGSKYYIGNANAAAMVTILGKQVDAARGAGKRAPFIFFALRPAESPAYRNVRKIRTLGIRTAFVGEFEVAGHHLPEGDVVAEGRDAWEAVHGTVTFGKYFLAFGTIGICERSFVEAIAHVRKRVLYGKPVIEMPHIRATAAVAFARLTAMKLYAFRALDYLYAAGPDERRFLLFTAVQKARVSTEGVKVVNLISECVGAKGFEADTYIELALREVPMVPGLEGSTHINYGLTAQFIDPYMAASPGDAPAPPSVFLRPGDPDENPYWWEAGDRSPKTVRFEHRLKAYDPLVAVPNVRAFAAQVQDFSVFAAGGITALNPALDAGLAVGIGKCLATIAYAQLVAEHCVLAGVAPSMVSVIFHGLIEDLSAEALKLAAMFEPAGPERVALTGVVRVPETIADDLEAVSSFIADRYEA